MQKVASEYGRSSGNSEPAPDPTDPDTKSPLDLSVLTRVEEAIGGRLLAYILDCEIEALPALLSGDIRLTERQHAIVSSFSALRKSIPETLDDLSVKLLVRGCLTQSGEDGKSMATSLRGPVAEDEHIPAGQDDIERALILLAVDAYPLLLLSPDPALPAIVNSFGPHIAKLLFRHPQQESFGEAVLQDPVLRDIYASKDEPAGHLITVPRGTDKDEQQLLLLSDMLLRSAWRQLAVEESTLSRFIVAGLEELRTIRAVFAGEKRTITAKLAFTGVLLPPGQKLKISEGVVRAVNELDRRSAPESLKGQLSSTDSSGVSTVINYDGDVLFEYKVRVRHTHTVPPSPALSARQPPGLQRTVVRLRFSLLLAAQRGYRVQLVETWRAVDMPLSPGIAMSWHDPRHGAGLSAIQLTEADMQAWSEWYTRLNAVAASKIEVALTRILRAIAERREPSDVLIDSVIAWESIFGTKEGEPTFRVTMCLAKLLKEDAKAREELKARLGEIYKLRSKVVHGGGVLKVNEHPLCNEALDVAIQAMRILIADRTDILKLADGAERSKVLLLE
jgi:hypothetical protein